MVNATANTFNYIAQVFDVRGKVQCAKTPQYYITLEALPDKLLLEKCRDSWLLNDSKFRTKPK